MTICEGKAIRPVVVVSREIVEACPVRSIGPAGHVRSKVADINAVLAHVQEDERLGWTRINHFGRLEVDPPRAAAHGPRVRASGQSQVHAAKSAYPDIHGHAANARKTLAIDGNRRMVRGTPPDPASLAAQRPKRAIGADQVD